MTEPRDMRLEDALAGKHGPEVQAKAEDAVKAAVDQLARMVGRAVGGAFKGKATGARKFASGGFVKSDGLFMVGNGDREHIVRRPGLEQLANSLEWREVPMPGPTRIVELTCSPSRGPTVIKGVIG
ncbi:hypothetical protein [Sphingopyxis sp. PET50]|uniref:hypothetical protein n=1 Tax=Sphingopyxis sp. PET50 TaxID=2976533 RepID=UPI0021AFDE39|nr:hypothetical protein [Sphingopyxis sp. PET50]